LQLGDRVLSAEEAVELLATALEDPAAVEQLLGGVGPARLTAGLAELSPEGPVGSESTSMSHMSASAARGFTQQGTNEQAAAEVAEEVASEGNGAGAIVARGHVRWLMQMLGAWFTHVLATVWNIMVAVVRALLGRSM
jgi:hypothetical protein